MIEEIDLNEAEEAALEAAWARLDETPVTECARCATDCPHGRPLQECKTGANAGKPGPCPDEGGGDGQEQKKPEPTAEFHKLDSGLRHILTQLATSAKSITAMHRAQPGVGSAMQMYHKTVMPAQELERLGYIERAGSLQGNIGIGASYAGPGSAPASGAEKDDPARDIYELTAKGRDLLGLPPAPPPEPEPEYDPKEDYRSRLQHAQVMLANARKELERSKGKPRLAKQAQDKIARFQAELAKIKRDFPQFARQ